MLQVTAATFIDKNSNILDIMYKFIKILNVRLFLCESY